MNNVAEQQTITKVLVLFPESGARYHMLSISDEGQVVDTKDCTYACNVARRVAEAVPNVDVQLTCEAIRSHRKAGNCDGVVVASDGEVIPYHKAVTKTA